MLADDRRVRLAGKIAHRGGMPVIAAGQPARFVHALLHHRPFARRGDDERVQVDLKSVGDGVVVDAGVRRLVRTSSSPSRPRRSARARSSSGVLRECLPRPPQTYMPNSPARGIQSPLQRAQHRSGDAGRMPVHAHDRAERLKPVWIAQTGKQLRWAVVIENAFGDRRPSRVMRSASQAGTRPPCRGRSAIPERFICLKFTG